MSKLIIPQEVLKIVNDFSKAHLGLTMKQLSTLCKSPPDVLMLSNNLFFQSAGLIMSKGKSLESVKSPSDELVSFALNSFSIDFVNSLLVKKRDYNSLSKLKLKVDISDVNNSFFIPYLAKNGNLLCGEDYAKIDQKLCIYSILSVSPNTDFISDIVKAFQIVYVNETFPDATGDLLPENCSSFEIFFNKFLLKHKVLNSGL